MAHSSDREKGADPRTVEETGPEAWRRLSALVLGRIPDGSFGYAFPDQCPDGYGIAGHDLGLLDAPALGHVMVWPLPKEDVPDTLQVMDLLEFCHADVARALQGDPDSYFRHHHFDFDVVSYPRGDNG